MPGDATYPFPRFTPTLRLALAAAMFAVVLMLDRWTGGASDQAGFIMLSTV